MRIRVLDVETTGLLPTDHVVEIAAWDLEPETGMVAYAGDCLVKPPVPIPAVASAVHHITDEDVERSTPWEHVWPIIVDDEVDAYAAHCAKFEQLWLGDKVKKPWVCTLKCAYRIWPDAPAHQNQVLRYHLKPPDLEVKFCQPAHRASADAYVTAHLLGLMFKNRKPELEIAAMLAGMVKLSSLPAELPKVQFGKHFGKKWSEVPRDYLEWIIGQKDMDEDVRHTAKVNLERDRQKAGMTYEGSRR